MVQASTRSGALEYVVGSATISIQVTVGIHVREGNCISRAIALAKDRRAVAECLGKIAQPIVEKELVIARPTTHDKVEVLRVGIRAEGTQEGSGWA